MATFRHPVTGVELNVVTVRRAHLTGEAELETVRLLRADGEPKHIIAAMFGINQGRISEAFPDLPDEDPAQGKLL